MKTFAPLSTFAMSLVAVSIGGHLSYRRIHNSIRRILSLSFFEVVLTVSCVMLCMRLAGMDWPTTFFSVPSQPQPHRLPQLHLFARCVQRTFCESADLGRRFE